MENNWQDIKFTVILTFSRYLIKTVKQFVQQSHLQMVYYIILHIFY